MGGGSGGRSPLPDLIKAKSQLRNDADCQEMKYTKTGSSVVAKKWTAILTGS